MPDLLFYAVAIPALFLVGLGKSGLVASLGMVGVPLLTLVMPARDAAGMMLPLLLIMDAIALVVYRREVDWKILWILIPGGVLGTAIGWALSAVVTDAAVRLAIGLISLAFVLDAWLPLREKLAGINPSRGWGTFWATISGFTSFVSHTGAPPIQIYLVPLRMPPALFAGTFAVFFAAINAIKLVPYAHLGQLSVSNLWAAATLVPVAIGGMLAGVFLVRRIEPALFYRLSYVFVFVLALKLIYDGTAGLF